MKPILRDFPYAFQSERLDIRGPLPGDGTELNRAVRESEEELKKWMPWALKIDSVEESEIRVREGQLKFLAREDLWMMLFIKGTNTIIGGSGLHRIDWSIPKFEIGYWVRTEYEKMGYITESTERITAFAFDALGAKRVEIRCDANNLRSAAIPKRLGFEHEGTMINEARCHVSGDLRSTMVFSKTK